MLPITSFYAAHTSPLSFAAILSTPMPCRDAEHNLPPSNAHLSSTAMQHPPCSLITPPSAIFPPPSPQPCCLHPSLSKLLTHHPHLGHQKQLKILCNNLPFISEAEDIHIKHSTQLNGVLNTKNIGNL